MVNEWICLHCSYHCVLKKSWLVYSKSAVCGLYDIVVFVVDDFIEKVKLPKSGAEQLFNMPDMFLSTVKEDDADSSDSNIG